MLEGGWGQGRQWALLLWQNLPVAECGRQVGAEGQGVFRSSHLSGRVHRSLFVLTLLDESSLGQLSGSRQTLKDQSCSPGVTGNGGKRRYGNSGSQPCLRIHDCSPVSLSFSV